MKSAKTILTVLAIIMVICALLSFDFIAAPVAKVVGKPVDAVKNLAKTIMFIAVGLALVYFGIMALPAMAVAGIGLILVGGFLVAQVVIPMLHTKAAGG